MAYYVVHPGNVTLQKTGQTVYVDAGTLAANYGLSPGEYDVATPEQEQSVMHVHLYPRPDALYRNIKTEVGDVPNGTLFYDHSAEWYKAKRTGQSRRSVGRLDDGDNAFNGNST